MNKLIVVLLVGMFLVSGVYAYNCIYQNDSDGVKEFKNNMNQLSIKQDLDSGLTPEAINLKLKYFGPCR